MSSVVTLNNNQITTSLIEAYKEALGSDALDTVTLKDIIDVGGVSPDSREAFTKSLLNVLIKNWYSDTSYRSQYDDPFYEDKEKFGALTQVISIDVPAVTASHAWTEYTSGTTTVGEYTVYLPVVDTQIYGKSNSWALPVTITDNQWNTAFRNETELAGFVSYVWLCVDNALVCHIEAMNSMNRNNFMAEKIHYQGTQNAVGVHAINLVEAYAKFKDPTTDLTVDAYRATPAALRHGSEQISLYAGYMQKMSTLFNTGAKKRFTPKDRLVCEILTQFEKDCEYNMEADTFHNDLVALPGHRSIPSWQALIDATHASDIDFSVVSSISVKTASNDTVSQSGIVALLVDKWAIAHTFIDQYLASQRFDINRLTHYEYQYTDRYLNNLTMNGIVFYLDDYTAPVEGGES